MRPKLNVRTLLAGGAGVAILAAGLALLVSTFAPSLGPWTLNPSDPRVSLLDVEREVTRRYRAPDVTAGSLADMMARGKVTLFDVRTQEEFDAGHLPGAIRVEPDSTAEQILGAHRQRLTEGPVVFYCAVGVRSSDMIMRTMKQIAPHAIAGVYNLRGGIFRWTADGRALTKESGPGEAHPYDENWGRLLARTLSGS
jgi:rhodanese-related sulfurtransferase